MKRIHALLALLLLVIFIAVHNYYSLPCVISRVRSSVVRVKVQGKYGELWSGSGVVLDNGLVLTAGHVVEDANNVFIEFDNGFEMESSKFFMSKDINSIDVGLIIIEDKFLYTRFAFNTNVDIGDNIFVIGSPFGNKNTVSLGIFSAYDRVIQGELLHQLDISGAPGSSGCPVFNRYGNIIGIIVRGNNYGIVYIVPLEMCKLIVDMYENVQKAKVK
uniref:Putative trypsin-like peptidase domain containing protein n=1 Tax=viral metagenome TaxID=1070528 RepID=A0A6M3KVP9_9ZZZZ